ncbi:MAG: YihY/virulence factor BrkB family protein [Gemmatimonadetes bacterium]|nr:YihY/virulence factor BrkB family protein [Gemmatimonadota bacterium]
MGLVEAMHSTIDHLRGWQRALEHRLARFVAWRLVVRTAGELRADDATHMAAGVAYYAVLSLFPLLLALIAGLSLALRSDTVEAELFDFFETYLPGSVELLEKNITAAAPVRGAIGLLGLLGLLWSASAIFGAISRAVNRAWDVHRDRPFYVAKLRHLAMAAGVGILFILSLTITTALQTLGGVTLPGVGSLSFLENTVVSIGGRVLPFLLSFAIFTLIYKFIPNTKTFWRYVWPGALLAAVLFELAKSVFILYLDRFANYQAVYGSIGSVIALLVWMYLSAFVLILGAEFSSEYGRMREGVDPGTLIDPNLLD